MTTVQSGHGHEGHWASVQGDEIHIAPTKPSCCKFYTPLSGASITSKILCLREDGCIHHLVHRLLNCNVHRAPSDWELKPTFQDFQQTVIILMQMKMLRCSVATISSSHLIHTVDNLLAGFEIWPRQHAAT